MSRRALNGIIQRARTDAYRVVYREARRVLPAGWTLYLMVGWGLSLDDEKGNTVIDAHQRADRLPKGVRNACLLAADFVETFGYANEKITGRKQP